MTQATASRAQKLGRSLRPAFCGRALTDEEWDTLHEILETCGFARCELAATICEALDWVRPTGGLKTHECYEYLNVLEERGLADLPARQGHGRQGPRIIGRSAAGEPGKRRVGELADVAPVLLGLAANADERALWRELVDRYHYLGCKVPYGAHLRYLVWISKPAKQLAGCVQFSSPARRLAVRDAYIGWDDATRQENLCRVINNSRFLVLPWLAIHGLASHVLAAAARMVADDWEEAYAVRPVLIETFIQQDRFEGTCYRAANWVDLGETAGRGRMDRFRDTKKPIKRCLVYALVNDFRRKLGVASR